MCARRYILDSEIKAGKKTRREKLRLRPRDGRSTDSKIWTRRSGRAHWLEYQAGLLMASAAQKKAQADAKQGKIGAGGSGNVR